MERRVSGTPCEHELFSTSWYYVACVGAVYGLETESAASVRGPDALSRDHVGLKLHSTFEITMTK